MSLSVLISEPEFVLADEMRAFLEAKSFQVDIALNGKACQLSLYKKKYLAVILDIETQNHSSFEVLKYVRLNAPSVKIILTVKNKKVIELLDLSEKDLRKLGASDIFYKPYSFDLILNSIEGANHFESWKSVKNSGVQRNEEEISLDDDDFTKIKISDFYSGNTIIFDCYVRLAKNKYIKILHQGDFFEESRIQKYIDDQKISFLYFMTKDRSSYINFINSILEKMIVSSKEKTEKKVNIAKNLTEKYIEEIYVSGLKPQLIEEGKKICNNIYSLVKKDTGLSNLLSLYNDYDPSAYSHAFLVSFFSAITCQNLDWATQRTVELTTMGAMFHDIGMLKLPNNINELELDNLSPEQLVEYRKHPQIGAELLQKYPIITEPIRQIVYQNHEYINGEGFPNGLTGIKIYPLAKIVSFADEFANLIVKKQLTPIQGLRELIPDRSITVKYDPLIIKALIRGFIKDKK